MSLTGIFIDNREPPCITNLKFGGVPVAITQLDCGDIWASTDDGNLLVIERKTPSDLLGSIKDGRLFLQCVAIRQKTPWAYLMICGALTHTLDGHVITDNRTTQFRFDDMFGALLSVQEMGVAVVVCQSDQHYEEAVIRLARRERGAEKVVQPRTQARVLTAAEIVLTSLPGIGVERAGLLLGEHGSAAYSIAWLTWLNTYAEISGIGDGTKHNVRKALGLKAEEWIAILDSEKAEYAAKELAIEATTPTLGVPAEN